MSPWRRRSRTASWQRAETIDHERQPASVAGCRIHSAIGSNDPTRRRAKHPEGVRPHPGPARHRSRSDAGRDHRPARRERCRQKHADEHPLRRAAAGCRGALRSTACPVRLDGSARPPSWDSVHPSGAVHRPLAQRRGEHLLSATIAPGRAASSTARRCATRAAALLARVGASHIDPRISVGRLRAGEQQLVEVAKALAGDIRLLIMDEPTSSLTDHEAQALFGQMRSLAAAGRRGDLHHPPDRGGAFDLSTASWCCVTAASSATARPARSTAAASFATWSAARRHSHIGAADLSEARSRSRSRA